MKNSLRFFTLSLVCFTLGIGGPLAVAADYKPELFQEVQSG